MINVFLSLLIFLLISFFNTFFNGFCYFDSKIILNDLNILNIVRNCLVTVEKSDLKWARSWEFLPFCSFSSKNSFKNIMISIHVPNLSVDMRNFKFKNKIFAYTWN